MPPKDRHGKIYTRRVNSNGEDVYPTVCATQYKMPQQQGDLSGAYILDYFKKRKKLSPLYKQGGNVI